MDAGSLARIAAKTVSGAVMIAAAFADGTAEEREAAYVTLEGAVKAPAIALLVACVKPLIQAVLCAPASKVGAEEYRRASLLLYEMAKADMVAVPGAGWARGEQGLPLCLNILTAPDTVFAAILAKEPGELTRDDAIIASASFAHHLPSWAAGMTPALALAGLDEMEMFGTFFKHCPCVKVVLQLLLGLVPAPRLTTGRLSGAA
jgi:hypothetical protein